MIFAVTLSAGLAAALLVVSSSLFAPGEVTDQQGADVPVPPVLMQEQLGQFGEAVYPYSVVPGGVHSPEELTRAVQRDPVVAAHYTPITISNARVATVAAPRRAYVSYRIGDKVYWTKKPIALHPGERILTDGTHEIRARCGNCISDTPQGPTSSDEPPESEFDRALASPASESASPPMVSPGAVPVGEPFAPFDPLAGPGLRSESIPVGGAPGGGAGAPDYDPPVPGSPHNIALLGSDPSDTGVPELFSVDPELLPPDDFPEGPPLTPPPPVPVPEPGSLLLLGTGLAGYAWRRHRARQRLQK